MPVNWRRLAGAGIPATAAELSRKSAEGGEADPNFGFSNRVRKRKHEPGWHALQIIIWLVSALLLRMATPAALSSFHRCHEIHEVDANPSVVCILPVAAFAQPSRHPVPSGPHCFRESICVDFSRLAWGHRSFRAVGA